jgi:DNA-binding response OmpR family regulator
MAKRILLVETSNTIRTLLATHCQQTGHLVIALATYEAGIQALYQLASEPPDVVIVAFYPHDLESYRMLAQVRLQPYEDRVTLIALVMQEDQQHRMVEKLLPVLQAKVIFKPFQIQEVLALLT